MKPRPTEQVRQWERFAALALVCCLLVAVAVVDGYRQTLGFPDGFVSPLDQAHRVLATIFIAVSLLVSLWLGVLGWRAIKVPIAQQLGATMAGYTLFVVLLVLLDLYLRFQLNHGRGG
jgi:hypothetical protein